jgi:hypothetical protein
MIHRKNNPDTSAIEKADTLTIIQEFKKKLFIRKQINIDITNLTVMKCDIKNYRPLTDVQLKQFEILSEEEKIEIIKTFNIMFETIEDLLN